MWRAACMLRARVLCNVARLNRRRSHARDVLVHSAMSHSPCSEVRAVESAAHRVGSDYFSIVPTALRPGSFRVVSFLELVAAARFFDADAVYVAFELVLPVGSGWRLLPDDDVAAARALPALLSDAISDAVAAEGSGGADGSHADDLERWYLSDEQEHHGRERDTTQPHEPYGSDGDEAAGSGGETGGLRHRRRGSDDQHVPSKGRRRAPRHKRRVFATRLQGITQVGRAASRVWLFGRTGIGSVAANGAGGPNSRSGSAFFGDAANGAAGNACNDSGTGMGGDALMFPGYGRTSLSDVIRQQQLLSTAAGGGQAQPVVPTVTRGSSKAAAGGGSVSLVSSAGCDETHASAPSSVAAWETTMERVAEPDPVPVAYLCHPIAINLLCDLGACTRPGGPAPPQLYFSVFSKDKWDRHRVQGYAYMNLETRHAGCEDVVLPCWKPEGSLRAQETDFFLGGATRLADVTYAGVPSTFLAADAVRPSRAASQEAGGTAPAFSAAAAVTEANVALSRFGFRSVSTGELGIRRNTILQFRPPPPRAELGLGLGTGHGLGRALGATGKAASMLATKQSVADILARVSAARRPPRDTGASAGIAALASRLPPPAYPTIAEGDGTRGADVSGSDSPMTVGSVHNVDTGPAVEAFPVPRRPPGAAGAGELGIAERPARGGRWFGIAGTSASTSAAAAGGDAVARVMRDATASPPERDARFRAAAGTGLGGMAANAPLGGVPSPEGATSKSPE